MYDSQVEPFYNYTHGSLGVLAAIIAGVAIGAAFAAWLDNKIHS